MYLLQKKHTKITPIPPVYNLANRIMLKVSGKFADKPSHSQSSRKNENSHNSQLAKMFKLISSE